MAKKFYAVKTGKVPGIFEDWASCKASVDGFPNAEYKGFATLVEAEAYLGIKEADPAASEAGTAAKKEMPPYETIPGRLLVYVDGSYHDGLKKYAFGCVFLLPGQEIRIAYGNGDNPQSLQHRNVTGEMLGAMYAVKTAMKNGYREIELCYDYEGIEKWVTGAWRSKTELTQKYAQSMREWGKSIQIFFTKVEAHSNVAYNELADQTAKRGLTEGNGIPKIQEIRELELYAG
ncbi:MAG: ribonuclease H family protein [Lachnospiraceae bacterium]|nr:ribonuclease H family protein [Lachnospiraceae bacterium]